jgi:hypothetical protein
MTLMAALPSGWEPTIIQNVMAAGTVANITYNDAKTQTLRYWDAQQARKTAHKPGVNKLSAVKRKPINPSF